MRKNDVVHYACEIGLSSHCMQSSHNYVNCVVNRRVDFSCITKVEYNFKKLVQNACGRADHRGLHRMNGHKQANYYHNLMGFAVYRLGAPTEWTKTKKTNEKVHRKTIATQTKWKSTKTTKSKWKKTKWSSIYKK